jgi:PAS domain S-box-containing protein
MHRPPAAPSDNPGLIDRAPCGLIVAAAGGAIVRVNQTFCRWLGYSASDLVETRRLQDLLTTGGKIFLQTHVMPLLQMQRSVAEIKLDLRRRDGSAVPMLINICRVSEAATEWDEVACMIMSDRHKYERELVHARARLEETLKAKEAAELALRTADRRKDEFLATLAHELRNPLGAMRTAIDLLRRPQLFGGDTSWPLELLAGQLLKASSKSRKRRWKSAPSCTRSSKAPVRGNSRMALLMRCRRAFRRSAFMSMRIRSGWRKSFKTC